MLCCRIQSAEGLLASYVHTSPAPGLGRMAALVALNTSSSSLTSEQQADAKASVLHVPFPPPSPVPSPSSHSRHPPPPALLWPTAKFCCGCIPALKLLKILL